MCCTWLPATYCSYLRLLWMGRSWTRSRRQTVQNGLAGTIVDFRSLAQSLFGRSLLREAAVCSRDIFPWSARTHVPVGTESVLTLHQPHGRGGRTTSSDHVVRVSKLQSSRRTPSRHARPLFLLFPRPKLCLIG